MFSIKEIWHKVIGRDPRLNDDGTMTTKHGNRIIPHKLSDSGFSSNIGEFMFQPRVREIKAQIDHVNYAKGQSVIIDSESGDFYLKNLHDSEEIIRKRPPLGQIDTTLEEGIFCQALQQHKMHQLFGDCSPQNPIVLDEGSGRVYAKNNPEKTRGFVSAGKTVHNPSPIK
tara:strand:- start:73597 stop:74106 length:510 start_codon:yes stop_codon:yes gene_type:complete